jgi:ABC-type proline/glycine betaine transport system substrate-binding protein
MRTRLATAIATAVLVSLAVATAPASAKTVKACQKEWQADKVAMQAAGKTEKAYVAECRGTPTAAAPATKPKEDKGGY